MRRLALLSILLALAASTARPQARISGGGIINVGPAAPITVLVAPTNASVMAGSTQTFIATLTNDVSSKGVTWSVTGAGCSGVTCGTISPTTSLSGQSVTYTAPAAVPSNPSISITAIAAQDGTRFTVTAVVVTATSSPIVVNNFTTTPKQAAAASNTFAVTATQGNLLVIPITAGPGTVLSGVTDNRGNTYASVSCSSNFTSGGHSEIWYAANALPGVTSIAVAESVVIAQNIDIGIADLSNGSSSPLDGSAVCNGSNVATTNPIGPAVPAASANEIVLAVLSVFDTAITAANPFTFLQLPRGDGTAYLLTTAPGTFTPSWTTTSGAYTFVGQAFRSGTQPAVISVNLTPATSSVATNATAQFTCKVTNDNANAGCDNTLSGAGCAGPTCGTVTAHTASNAAMTYTAPNAVPAPATVTLTSKSTTDAAKQATSTITVVATPVIGVTVAPTNSSVTAGSSSIPVTATVTNDAFNGGVTWAFTGGACTGAACGTISNTSTASGVATNYTPPATVTSSLSVTLTATSVTNNTKSAAATILVSPQVGPFTCAQSGTCPAFPGAQGGGASTLGGRGGTRIEVTTTSDGGSGSFRACALASGPRICIFRVAGLFPIASELQINNPFLTIDGQTAPGEVILGGPNTPLDVIRVSTHDVIIRYITASPDNRNVLSGPQGGTSGIVIINCAAVNNVLGTGGCYNVIVDHVTTRWAGNKNFAVFSNFAVNAPDCQVACNGPNHLITWSWSLMYEPHVGHPVGIGNGIDESYSNGCTTNCQVIYETDQDWHHSLFVNIDHRIPEGPMIRNRWVSNIVYNWSWFSVASLGTDHFDVINNRWISGNLNSAGPAEPFPIFISDCSAQGAMPCSIVPSVYLSGNIGAGSTTVAADQYTLANKIVSENGSGVGAIPANWRRTAPISNQLAFPIATDAAANLVSLLLPSVGNSQHLDCQGNWVNHRDPAETRIINQVQTNGSGAFWPNASYPPIANQSSPNQIPVPTTLWTDQPVTGFTVCTESLHDGIPDAWKTKYGLSLTDTGLSKRVNPQTGFDYLETYAGGLVP